MCTYSLYLTETKRNGEKNKNISTNIASTTNINTPKDCVSEAGSIGLPEDTLSVFTAEVLVD